MLSSIFRVSTPLDLTSTANRWRDTYLPRHAVWRQQITSHVPAPWCRSAPANYITCTHPVMLFGISRLHHTYLPHDTVWDQQIAPHVPASWCCLAPAAHITRTHSMMLFGTSGLQHMYLPHDAVWDQQITTHVPTPWCSLGPAKQITSYVPAPWCCLGPADYITRTHPMMLFGTSRLHHTYLLHDAVWDQQFTSHVPSPWCCSVSANALTRTYPVILFGINRWSLIARQDICESTPTNWYDTGNGGFILCTENSTNGGIRRKIRSWQSIAKMEVKCCWESFVPLWQLSALEQASFYTRLILTDQNCSPSSPLQKKQASNQSVNRSIGDNYFFQYTEMWRARHSCWTVLQSWTRRN